MMKQNKKYYFVFYKSSFGREVADKYETDVIAATKEDILFSNIKN